LYTDERITDMLAKLALIEDKNQNADLLFFSKW